MRGMIQFTFALVVASICQCIWSSPSQATTADEYVAGKIAGRVVEAETGDPLIGATVYIEEISQGAVVAPDGSYAIINVAPGVYTVRASMIGFGTVRRAKSGFLLIGLREWTLSCQSKSFKARKF